MGNQGSQQRRISTENGPLGGANPGNGLSLSAGPTPRKFIVTKVELPSGDAPDGTKLEIPRRPRRHSDADKPSKSSKSRSPSPQQRTLPRPAQPSKASPRFQRRSQPSPGDTLNGRPRTPRLAFKKFQAEFSLTLMALSGKRSRRQSAEQEVPLSFKIPEGEVDHTPLIPREEMFEPVTPDGDDKDKASSATTFRARATTISNGHVARLKTLMENQESSSGSTEDAEKASEKAKRPRPIKRKKIPTVFRYYLSKVEKSKLDSFQFEKCFIAGTMTNWRAMEMVKPKGDQYFVVILECDEGDNYFKFYIDGEWKIDESQEKLVGRSNVKANIIRVKRSDSEVLEALACDSFIVKASKKETMHSQSKWGQVRPKFDNHKPANPPSSSGTRSSSSTNPVPPFLPPQLLTSLLNSETFEKTDPNLLPEPTSHVMLHHLYAQSVKDNVLVMASTTRFRKKYATVVLYKPID